jgi:predicted negative regulator of RcsB-dependent stress response
VAIYDTEEEQLEQLKRWWETNQSAVLAGIIGAIVIVSALNYWQHHQLETRNQASQTYQSLLESAAKDDLDTVEKLADKLNTDYSSSAYAQYAALQLAKTKVQKGDLEAAKAILEKELHTSKDPIFINISRLRLIELQLATKQYEQGLQLIANTDPSTTAGFAASYDELQGDLYVALDRVDEARSAYQSALRSGQATPLVQFKLDDLTSAALNPNATPK